MLRELNENEMEMVSGGLGPLAVYIGPAARVLGPIVLGGLLSNSSAPQDPESRTTIPTLIVGDDNTVISGDDNEIIEVNINIPPCNEFGCPTTNITITEGRENSGSGGSGGGYAFGGGGSTSRMGNGGGGSVTIEDIPTQAD